MIFTNLIISSLLMSSNLTVTPISLISNTLSKSIEINQNNFFKMNSSILLLNSFSLISTDIQITKTNYNSKEYLSTPIYSNGKKIIGYQHEENNPIADIFWKNNLWTVGYITANFANITIVSLLDKVDNTGISGYCYSLILNVAEIIAISSWSNSPYTPNNLYIKTPILTINF